MFSRQCLFAVFPPILPTKKDVVTCKNEGSVWGSARSFGQWLCSRLRAHQTWKRDWRWFQTLYFGGTGFDSAGRQACTESVFFRSCCRWRHQSSALASFSSFPKHNFLTQEEMFATVGKPIADSCLAGFHGTIFAYGQTGSGKTYTIQGSRLRIHLAKTLCLISRRSNWGGRGYTRIERANPADGWICIFHYCQRRTKCASKCHGFHIGYSHCFIEHKHPVFL